MTFIYLIAFVLICVGVIFVLGLTPEQVNEDLSGFFDKQQTLQEQSQIARGKKKQNKLLLELNRMRRVLKETGKEKQFSLACAISLLLMIVGCILAIVIGNAFLIPVLAVTLAMIPFAYIKGNIASYNAHVKQSLELTLGSVTLAYADCPDLRQAVSQEVERMRPPIRGVFEEFLVESETVSANIEDAILKMRDKIDNPIWREWCTQLIACQRDSSLRTTLQPTVAKLSVVNQVNMELKTKLSETRREYYFMVTFVLGNIPLLYCLNRDWYDALMYTVVGKLVLAITGVVILVTAIRTLKLTKPIEYKL